MANVFSIPLDVLVINPRPNKLTRFVLDCEPFDNTTEITVTDPGIAAQCEFDVLSAVVVSRGPPTRLLVAMRFKKKMPGPMDPTRPLAVSATTGLGGAAVTASRAVTAYFHSRKAAVVGRAARQALKLALTDPQPIDIPVSELGGIVSATVESSTSGHFEVTRTSYDGARLRLMLSSKTAGRPPVVASPFVGITVTLNCDDDTTPMDPVPVEITFS